MRGRVRGSSPFFLQILQAIHLISSSLPILSSSLRGGGRMEAIGRPECYLQQSIFLNQVSIKSSLTIDSKMF
jgi:hypothetical protein